MAAARYDSAHSQLVFWLKILLPLGAVALLSTLFLVSNKIRPEDAIPYAKVDITDRIREPRLTAPDYSGVTEDGAALSLKAAEARPGASGNNGQITAMDGLLETPDGAATKLTAAMATLNQTARTVALSGGVSMTNSTGFSIVTQTVIVSIDRTGLDAGGGIKAEGPFGQVQSQTMHLGKTGDGTGGYVLVFKEAVQLIYMPGKHGTEN